MKSTTPSKQPFDFSGSVATHYDQYLGPLFFEPYAIEVAKRIDASSIRLAVELASGTGRVTRHLLDVLPQGSKLIASDVSADMLAVAKDKLKNAEIEWKIVDAQNLPFADNSVDLVVCCFGLMFVPDKARALSEVFRVLRTGSMFIFTTWDRLETSGVSLIYRNIAKDYLPNPLPESYNLPSSMHDESLIRSMLQKAGFSKIMIGKVAKQSFSKTAKDAAEALTVGGSISNEIMSRNPEWIDEIKQKLEAELSRVYGAAPMMAPMSAVLGQAWK